VQVITLGIESSCDDTAVGIAGGGKILAHRALTQTGAHECYGGVVPEIASRAHLSAADKLVEEALADAGLKLSDIDLFAAGAGPGLIGGVVVGLSLAQSLAFAAGKNFVAVNHLEAHALMPTMFAEIPYPYLLFLASGGHTQLVKVNRVGDYELLGTTLDDACGECFDKVAKLLGFSYMGGREVERLAGGGNPRAFDFPRPLINSHGLDFSFSGLKTAVRLQVEKGGSPEDIAASFQAAAVEVIGAKVRKALTESGAKALVASGGVASNMALRSELTRAATEAGVEFFAAPPKYCVDNGVMIAHAAELAWNAGRRTGMGVNPRPRWPLSELRND